MGLLEFAELELLEPAPTSPTPSPHLWAPELVSCGSGCVDFPKGSPLAKVASPTLSNLCWLEGARPWALLSGCRIFANSAAASSRFLSSLPQTSEIPKNPFIPLSGTPFLLRSILRFCSWPHKGMKDGCLKIHESSRGPNVRFPICGASVDLRYNHLSSMGFFRGLSVHAIFPLLDSNNRFLPWPLAIVFVFFSTIWAKKPENFRFFPHQLHSLKLQTRSSTGSNHTWALSSCLMHESILHEGVLNTEWY